MARGQRDDLTAEALEEGIVGDEEPLLETVIGRGYRIRERV